MSLTEKFLWHVEMNLREPVSLSDLAKLCTTSPAQLVRAVQASCGHAPMGYMRARRLAHAAKLLASQKSDILNVALEVQFSSHEAFTRAFQRHFGCPPSHITSPEHLKSLTLTEPIKMDKSLIIDVPPHRFDEAPDLRIIGLSGRFSIDTISEVPPMWLRFAELLGAHEALYSDIAYGVSCDPNEDGTFRYTAGVELPSGVTAPKEMYEVFVPAGRYAVFEHIGHISNIARTIHTIWNKSLSDAGLTSRGAPDFERYDTRFDAQTGRGTVEIWIPVA